MKTFQSLSCIISGLVWSVGIVHAQHAASVAVGVERIENPALAATSPGGVTVLRIAPSYALDTESDRSRSRLSLGAVLEQSSNTALLASRNYPSLGYTWTHAWPTASLELRGNLVEAATRNTELEDLGRITVDSRERVVTAGASWDRELTERTQLSLDWAHSRVSYDSRLLTGYREFRVSSRFSWEQTERLTSYFEPSYGRLTSSGTDPATTQTRWLVGLRGELAPGWSLASFAGQARTSGSPSAIGTVAGLQLTFAGSRWSSEADWSRDLTPSAATTAYVRTESMELQLGYRMTEGATLSAALTRSRSGGVGGSRGQVVSLSMDNELGLNWSSTMGVEDRRTTSMAGFSASGWAIRAGLVYAYPGR